MVKKSKCVFFFWEAGERVSFIALALIFCKKKFSQSKGNKTKQIKSLTANTEHKWNANEFAQLIFDEGKYICSNIFRPLKLR